MGWVYVYLDDVCSDLSAFHGIRDADEELTAEAFFLLAERLPAYQGVLAARAAEEHAARNPAPLSASGSREAPVQQRLKAAQQMPVATAADLNRLAAGFAR